MYSAKEKLHHFRQLSNPHTAEVDLILLRSKKPQEDFTRFELAPRKNAEDILFALLDVASHDEIVRNRREVQKEKENKKPDETLNSSGKKTTNEGKSSKTQTPSGKKTTEEGKECKVPTPPEKKKTSSKKKKKNTPK